MTTSTLSRYFIVTYDDSAVFRIKWMAAVRSWVRVDLRRVRGDSRRVTCDRRSVTFETIRSRLHI